jgi:hypothetical protein
MTRVHLSMRKMHENTEVIISNASIACHKTSSNVCLDESVTTETTAVITPPDNSSATAVLMRKTLDSSVSFSNVIC